jgi:hypothetical protein
MTSAPVVLADLLAPGDLLEAAAGGGRWLPLEIERLEGVAVDALVEPGSAYAGLPLALRLRGDGEVLFVLLVITVELATDGRERLTLRAGSVLRMSSERVLERARFHAPVVVRASDGTLHEGRALDLSPSGIRVVTPYVPRLGERLEIVLETPDGPFPLDVEVVRRDTASCEVAATVVTLSDSEWRRLERLVA